MRESLAPDICVPVSVAEVVAVGVDGPPCCWWALGISDGDPWLPVSLAGPGLRPGVRNVAAMVQQTSRIG